jgi:putative DNA primase/helicase
MGYALEQLGPDKCREIAEGLFKVEKMYGGVKLHGFCPIHGDQKTSSFVYHFTEDWFKCQSCGAGGDLVTLWQEVTGKGFKDFKDEYADGEVSAQPRKPARERSVRSSTDKIDESGWGQQRLPEVFVPEETLEALPPLPVERIAELEEQRGWSQQVIEVLDLREFTDLKGNKRIAIPIRDDQGRLCNIRQYSPGADLYKVISWFDPVCPACGGKWKIAVTGKSKKKTCIQCGALPNDYGRTRLYPSPAQWKQGLLWVCEGEPDLICALSQGLNAVTQTAGCGTWRDEFSRLMAGRDVVIAYDADVAGFKGAHVAAKSIAQQAKGVRVLVWPGMMGSTGG